jgi:LmbE family N-acetylglucosaminyl deacetylase
MRICIVSPHLDDALLSCGIMAQRRRAAGDEVFALNIFTAGTNSANRKNEDRAAQKVIGVEAVFLDELDAPDRDAQYVPLKNLFFGRIDASHDALIDRVKTRVTQFFADKKIDLAYFPLGAGGHIDHRTAYEAGRRIASTPVRFYEDRPYILWPGVLEGRLHQIGSDAKLPPVSDREMLATIHDYHYLKHFVPEGYYQEECLPLYFAALNQKSSNALKSKDEEIVASEAELKKLYESLACYESQMHYIYSSYDNFIHDSRAHELHRTGRSIYAERSWSLQAA